MVAWFAPFLTSVWWHIGKYEIKNIFSKSFKSLYFWWNLSSGNLFWWKKYPTLPIYVYYYFWTLWFRYRFRYRPKVSANYSFGFGIGPKPKWWFRSFTIADRWYHLNGLGTFLISRSAVENIHTHAQCGIQSDIPLFWGNYLMP